MRLIGNKSKFEVASEFAEALDYALCRAKTCPDGSPGTTVLDHCRYAGAIAGKVALTKLLLFKDVDTKSLAYMVALHDVGKVSLGFQRKYFSSLLKHFARKSLDNNCSSNHAEIGAESMMKMWNLNRDHPLIYAIAMHHGSCDDCLLRNNDDGENWQRERQLLASALAENFNCEKKFQGSECVDSRLLAGLTCVSDWLASDERYFPPSMTSLSHDQLTERVDAVMRDAGFISPQWKKDLTFGDVFKDKNGNRFLPRPEQKALIDAITRPGVYVMEATMGAGKTEAALYAAYKMLSSGANNGIYFALPTRLTSDRIYKRMESFLKAVETTGAAIRLSHGRAWLDNYKVGVSGPELPSWFEPSKRGLIYPFAVGTIDQALLSVMNVKHSFVRFYGLAGKVVILDEVHSYDMYTGSLVDTLVKELRSVGCTVIILSATLTADKRAKLLDIDAVHEQAYPLVSKTENNKQVSVHPKTDNADKNINLKHIIGSNNIICDAILHARKGANVLCIANTVRTAQLWYNILRQEMNEDDEKNIPIGILHSRFLPIHRSEIENKWLELLGKDSNRRPEGSILISTQIVEQSVDIDADYMISELAPIDMMLQRTGRLWRHKRDNRPEKTPILSLALNDTLNNIENFTSEQFKEAIGQGSCYVYSPYVLYRTWKILRDRQTLTIPKQIRELIEGVYSDINESPGTAQSEMKEQLIEDNKRMRLLAQSAEARVTSLPVMGDPSTRFGSKPSVNLLVIKSIDRGLTNNRMKLNFLDGTSIIVRKDKRDFATIKKLYDNIVPVTIREGLKDRSNNSNDLIKYFHSYEMPLIVRRNDDGSLVLDANNSELELAYYFDKGICDNDNVTLSASNHNSNNSYDESEYETTNFIDEVEW